MAEFELDLFADYHQFYLQDDEVEKNDLGDAWTEETIERLSASIYFAIGIGTVRNMDVPVFIKILEAKPSISFDDWEYVVMTSIEYETEKLVIAGCTNYFPDAM
ncbi:TPA: hypothetical protein ACX6RQ_003020 [Photobacterium damselae]|uniref:hypothetical protein n=2 Tax=Photobacterium damselae TaxID=38293 RepID=UPI0035A97B8B